jgi:hypothetical protein
MSKRRWTVVWFVDGKHGPVAETVEAESINEAIFIAAPSRVYHDVTAHYLVHLVGGGCVLNMAHRDQIIEPFGILDDVTRRLLDDDLALGSAEAAMDCGLQDVADAFRDEHQSDADLLDAMAGVGEHRGVASVLSNHFGARACNLFGEDAWSFGDGVYVVREQVGAYSVLVHRSPDEDDIETAHRGLLPTAAFRRAKGLCAS